MLGISVLAPFSVETIGVLRNTSSRAVQAKAWQRRLVVGDDFTIPDKVKAPRVCMCRIDYQTRSATAQSTRLTDSYPANHTNRDRQEKHCFVFSRQVWLSNTMGKDGESDRHNASQAN